jgi:alkaline phosphatase
MSSYGRFVVLVIAVVVFGVPVHSQARDWFAGGQAALQKAKKLKPVEGRARNVILFVGDGMGVSTVTAARILEGQLQGHSGEENQLAFEQLPYLALSKTYSVNQQTPDSAPTMNAMMTGVKTNDGIFGVGEAVRRKETRWSVVNSNRLMSLLELAELRGLSNFLSEMDSRWPWEAGAGRFFQSRRLMAKAEKGGARTGVI